MKMNPESRTNLSNQSQPTGLQHPRRLSRLATLAIAGQVSLLASAWLLPFVSDYSLVGDNISELVLGRYGFVQTIAFVIAGLGILGLAFAIRALTVGSRGSIIGSLLIGSYGAGAILSAIFPTDHINSPADVGSLAGSLSTTGTIHVVVALVSFLCVIIGMFVLTRTFFKKAQWRSFSPWLMLFPAGALALLFAQSQGPLVGLMQRLLVTVIAAWLILVAFKVRAIALASEAGTAS